MAVSLALAKQHQRVVDDSEDDLIESHLAAAQAWVENYTGKKLVRGGVAQVIASFEEYAPLLWGPDPADLTIIYLDGDEEEQTITDARIAMGRAYPLSAWPATATNSAIILEYTAGFSATPADLDHAVLLLCAEFYQNREAGVASQLVMGAVENLCRPYRGLWA